MPDDFRNFVSRALVSANGRQINQRGRKTTKKYFMLMCFMIHIIRKRSNCKRLSIFLTIITVELNVNRNKIVYKKNVIKSKFGIKIFYLANLLEIIVKTVVPSTCMIAKN